MPNIYLGNRSGQYDETITRSIKATYKVTSSVLSDCKNILKVAYDISYGSGFDGLSSGYYTFQIYSGTQNSSGRWESTIHCNSEYNCFVTVQAYYSPFDRSSPLLMSFFTRGTAWYQTFNKLKTSTYYYLLKLTDFNQVDHLAKQEYRSICLKNIFQFTKGSTNNYHIKQIPSGGQLKKIGHNKFKTITYMVDSGHRGGPFLFYTGNLFALKQNRFGIKNEIDDSTLLGVIDSTYNMLSVYYINSTATTLRTSSLSPDQPELKLNTKNDIPGDTAIFFEFIKEWNTRVQFERTSISQKQWSKVESPTYFKDDFELLDKLEQIKSSLYDLVTYEIDYKTSKSSNYNNDSLNVSVENQNSYVIYTHTPTANFKNNKSEIMYNKNKFRTEASSAQIKDQNIQQIRVFYRNETPTSEYTNPILLAEFTEKGDTENSSKYYRRTSPDGQEWSLVTPQTLKEMQLVGVDQTNQDISAILKTAEVLLSLLLQIELTLFYKVFVLLNKVYLYRNTDVQQEINKNGGNIILSDKQSQKINSTKTSLGDNFFYYTQTIKPENNTNKDIVIIPYIYNSQIYTHNKQKTQHVLNYGGSGGKYMSSRSPDPENRDEIYVFYYKSYNLPLLFLYCKTLYAPSSKLEYHNWVEVKTLNSFDTHQILNELRSIRDKFHSIDLSAINESYNLSKKFSPSHSNLFEVQIKTTDYNECDLFGYHTHTYKSSFSGKTSKLAISADSNRILVITIQPSISLEHVDVYYSKRDMDKMVLVAISEKNRKVNYYRYDDFIKKETDSFKLSEISPLQISGSNGSTLTDCLIDEENGRNTTITYRLDKSTSGASTSYNKSSISLTKKTELNINGYSFYTHTPSKPNRSHVLYKNKFVTIENNPSISEDPLNDLVGHTFTSISTYSLVSNDKFPLLMELKEDRKRYFLYRLDKSDTKWKQIKNVFSPSSEQIIKILDTSTKVKSLLEHINYLLEKSVIIDLRQNQGDYSIKYLNNSDEDINSGTEAHNNNNIKVIDSGKVKEQYPYYRHNLVEMGGLSNIKITGLRLKNNDKEVQLFNSTGIQDDNREYLYYKTGKSDVYVYFNRKNQNPIMLCYEGQAYGPNNKDEKDTKWIRLTNIKTCNVPATDFSELNKIASLLGETEGLPDSSLDDGRSASQSGHPNLPKPDSYSTDPQALPQEGSAPQNKGTSTTVTAVSATGGLAAVAGLVGGGFFALKHLGIIGVSAVAAAV